MKAATEVRNAPPIEFTLNACRDSFSYWHYLKIRSKKCLVAHPTPSVQRDTIVVWGLAEVTPIRTQHYNNYIQASSSSGGASNSRRITTVVLACVGWRSVNTELGISHLQPLRTNPSGISTHKETGNPKPCIVFPFHFPLSGYNPYRALNRNCVLTRFRVWSSQSLPRLRLTMARKVDGQHAVLVLLFGSRGLRV